MRSVTKTREDNNEICVILYGSRYYTGMKSFGAKQLYKNHYGNTLLNTQLHSILQVFPKAEIISVIGYECDRVARLKDSRFRIVENQLFQDTNEAEDIRLGLQNTNKGRIIFINSDLYFNHYALHSLDKSAIVYDTRKQLDEFEIGMTIVDKHVTRLDFQLEAKWCNILSLEGLQLQAFRNIVNRNVSKLYMFELINLILDKNVKLQAIEPHSSHFLKIDTPDKYRKFINLV